MDRLSSANVLVLRTAVIVSETWRELSLLHLRLALTREQISSSEMEVRSSLQLLRKEMTQGRDSADGS